MKQQILSIIESADLNGFTALMKGDKLHRYIVTYTSNTEFSLSLLSLQYYNTPYPDNITLGGWMDTETKLLYIDIGTSTNSLEEAIQIGRKHNQIAIRDNEIMEEIRL